MMLCYRCRPGVQEGNEDEDGSPKSAENACDSGLSWHTVRPKYEIIQLKTLE